jgi:YidC/Oxa1 family membrane protein insertase
LKFHTILEPNIITYNSFIIFVPAARYAQELMLFMKEKGLNPILNLVPPLAQAPVFISMFLSLRGLSNLPIESFRTGGMYWFEDLTVPDQYFLLPILTSATLLLTIEVGVRGALIGVKSANQGFKIRQGEAYNNHVFLST